MDNKATLSYSFSKGSDESLFLTLSAKLVETLSSHPIEWHHAYGRKVYNLCLKTKILPLTSALLERADLVTRPYCHIFWTDCNELDLYKSSVKNEIMTWLNLVLKQSNSEWIIVLVTGDAVSRLTKSKLIPRMSITDKVKGDFCSKAPDRLHILHDPNRDTSKSSDSWTHLGSKIASMTVRCMEAVVSKYEDQVRTERERRNEKSWDFCSYFLFQEELAFMYEMLAMYDSAQVQYDELDAMFTQYVLNANAGDYAHWLGQFSRSIVRWHSLLLWKPMDSDARLMIQQGEASLIDVRNYLFNRLCHLLFRMGKLSEVIHRLHDFLHSISTEIEILEISVPAGAVECWIFMCCLELIEALKRRSRLQSENPKMKKVDVSNGKLLLEYASLWNLARLKLQFLGHLCGLMPNDKTTSSHLQSVVDLLAGMGEGEERGEAAISPALTLREALSSKNNFQKHYFELAELAIGTFKHMKHYRAAKSIGSDLAEFYMLLGQPSQAESYLVDAVRMYASDGWLQLHSNANKVLAKCYKQMNNYRKYLRLCYALMCDKSITEQELSFYCDEFSSLSANLGDRTLAVNVWPLAAVKSVRFFPAQTSFRLRDEHFIELCIMSFAPKPMQFQSIHISLEYFDEQHSSQSRVDLANQTSAKKNNIARNNSSTKIKSTGSGKSVPASYPRQRHVSSTSSRDLLIDPVAAMDSDGVVELLSLNNTEPLFGNRPSRLPGNLNFVDVVDTQDDGPLAWAGVTCGRVHELLRRQDSNPSQRNKYSIVTSVVMENYDRCLSAPGATLNPGSNVIRIPLKTDVAGTYQLQQLRLTLHKAYFLLPRVYPIISYTVTCQTPTITVDSKPGLIAGLVQELLINIDLGDHQISEDLQENLSFHLPSNLHFLKINKCVLSSAQGELNMSSSPFIFEDSIASWRLPPSSGYRKMTLYLSCLCDVEASTHKLGHVTKHRRTHSAPSVAFICPPSSAPRHRTIDEMEGIGNEDELNLPKTETGKVSNNRELKKSPHSVLPSWMNKSDKKLDAIKNSVKETLTPFKFFRSNKSPSDTVNKSKMWPEIRHNKTNSDSNIPSLRVNGDFIEVTLNDEGGDGNETASSSDDRSLKDVLFRDDTLLRYSSQSDVNEEEPLPNVDLNPECTKLKASKSVDEVRKVKSSPKPTVKIPVVTTECMFDIKTPWTAFPTVTSSISFARPVEFTHAWNYCGPRDRFLSVAVENVTSILLTLRKPLLRFNDVINMKMTYMGRNEMVVKPSASCLFVWKVSLPSNPINHLFARFNIDLVSSQEHISEQSSTTLYSFDIDIVKPIYTIKCGMEAEGNVVSGQMTSLHIDVERLREDPGHETTANGQQLLMYQVVDNRGRWAVCGKSSGILSFKTTSILAEGEDSFDGATMEVMPLVSGHLHLPYVMLHRYMKRRSSEFDERLSSTDSPVLKPPQLKPFDFGEVIYTDQARQVNVLSADVRSVTEL